MRVVRRFGVVLPKSETTWYRHMERYSFMDLSQILGGMQYQTAYSLLGIGLLQIDSLMMQSCLITKICIRMRKMQLDVDVSPPAFS